MRARQFSPSDWLLSQADRVLRQTFGDPLPERPSPSTDTSLANTEAEDLPAKDRRESVALMRVNHAGEVAAQALYHGQSLTARDPDIAASLERAAVDEQDHLAWCRERVRELGGQTSVLDPVWYAGAFTLGALAGLAGDEWNLGFVAETERQVVAHLEDHLERLPEDDTRSRVILEQMKEDELRHGESAERQGGRALPPPIRLAMAAAGKIMTRSSYWI